MLPTKDGGNEESGQNEEQGDADCARRCHVRDLRVLGADEEDRDPPQTVQGQADGQA